MPGGRTMPAGRAMRFRRAMRARRATMTVAAVAGLLLAGCGTDATAGAGTPAGDPLTVEQALAHRGDEPVAVRGMAYDGGDGVVRLCAAILESFPPQCGGDHLGVTDADALIGQLEVALQVEGDVAWSPGEVVVWGYRRGADGFEPNLAAAGRDAGAEDSVGY